MQRLLILQSLWAMERRHTDGFERSLEENIEMIVGAGFDGVTTHCANRDAVRRLHLVGDRSHFFSRWEIAWPVSDEMRDRWSESLQLEQMA